MRRVCVEVSAAIRAEHLDRELRCQRSLFDRLRAAFQCLYRLSWFEVLNGPLPDEEQSSHDRNRQKDINGAPRHIHPEVSYRPRRMPGETTNHRNRDCNTYSRGNKVLYGECCHLN